MRFLNNFLFVIVKWLRFFVFLLPLIPNIARADETFDWMNSSITGLASTVTKCIEVPDFNSFKQSTTNLNINNVGTWIPTTILVNNGKLLKLQWNTNGITVLPQKYLVLFRIDPRFARPVVFIQKYDPVQQQYISDFQQYNSSIFANYQANPALDMSGRKTNYNNYVNFISRNKISVNSGDVINISLAGASDFFNSSFPSDLDNSNYDYRLFYTTSPITNKIIYAAADIWCNAISNQSASTPLKCPGSTYGTNSSIYNQSLLVGNPAEPRFTLIANNISSCSSGSNTMYTSNLCYYDQGRGVKFTLNGATIKDNATSLFHSNLTNANFFYYKAKTAGVLDFVTDWQIKTMFANLKQQLLGNLFSLVSTPAGQLTYNSEIADPQANFLHFGRYFFMVEVGSGTATISNTTQSTIQLEYMVVPESDLSVPDNTAHGTSFDSNYTGNAPADGYLWIRVANADSSIGGNIQVNITNYSGTTWFSDIVYGQIVQPLQQQFHNLVFIIYSNLTGNPVLKLIAQLMLTLYVMMYGLYFLAGATQISIMDFITRVVKISIIVALFSQNSWTFFNDNLFNIFISGIDELMTKVVGASSSATNIFGFVDPIFDRYTRGDLWSLLGIQLLQIQNGVAFFTIMVIYSILIFFRGVLEVIVSYCLAFVALSVMISLAPIFITFILFERTRGIFDNWISLLFSYTVQPTILLVFFLLIDQMMAGILSGIVNRACWDILISFKFGLDLNNIGVPISFSFTLPFLSGIPFYVPQIAQMKTASDPLNLGGTMLTLATTSLLFYSYCLMSKGLVDYVTMVVSRLTNVEPARKEGLYQAADNPTADVLADVKSIAAPVRNLAASAESVFKRKLINQDYSVAGSKKGDGDEEYHTDQIKSGSRHDVGSSTAKKDPDNK